MILGRNSGPMCVCLTKENLFNKNKIIYSNIKVKKNINNNIIKNNLLNIDLIINEYLGYCF